MQEPTIGDAIRALTVQRAAIIDVVAADLAPAVPDPARRADLAARAVGWLLDELVAGAVRPRSLDGLREAARSAAAAGRPVTELVDAHLSAGWAIWEAASSQAIAVAVLPALGSALLRAGDAAAAAIAAASAQAEASLAARGASARREFLDELLGFRSGDPVPARILRRASGLGLDPGGSIRVVVAAGGREVEDDDAVVSRVATILGPRAAIVATDRGRIIILARPVTGRDPTLRAALDGAFGVGSWAATAAEAAAGISGVGLAAAAAHEALDVLRRLGQTGGPEAAEGIAFERALLADEAALRSAVRAALAPLVEAPRTGPALLETLRVFLETGANRRETARRLGLATRTVAYRLSRIEALLGARLTGPTLIRLAAVLYAATLLGPPVRPAVSEASARGRR